MKPTLPVLLSINSGYVDTAGFLALQGLFTSHVTGNFVTLGAALTLGTSGTLSKLLALPVFCVVVLAIRLGPFHDGDSLAALLTGMILVAAMAVQNAVHRTHLSSTPPSTIMTGNTTQIMLDLADLLRGTAPEAAAAIRPRLRNMGMAVAAFAAGCAAAAFAYHTVGVWSFVVPPALALLAIAAIRGD